MTEVYGEALAFLQKTSASSGSTVYDQLVDVVAKVLEERPAESADLLETLLLAKKTAYEHKGGPVSVPQAEEPKPTGDALSVAQLFLAPEPAIDPETGEAEAIEPPNDFETEDLLAGSALLESVGCGLGTKEMYKVMLALKSLGEDPTIKAATVRFFGKIFGTTADYYVFEATLKEPVEAEAEETEGVPSEVNTGANGFVYFVTTNLGEPCTKLPDVTPDHIKKARFIKKFLTGDLSSEVAAYPVYSGKEAMYLRAQIARIAATTTLCPTGFFKLGEDGAAVEKNEEYAATAPGDMELGGWCHRYPHIKKQGRCTVYVPPVAEGEEAPEPTEEESEVGPPLLATIDTDEEAGLTSSWTKITSSLVPGVKHTVTGVRSNLWPGAVAVTNGTSFINAYVGYGIKGMPFVPMPPPVPQREYEGDLVESNEVPPPPAEPEAEEGEGEGEEAAE